MDFVADCGDFADLGSILVIWVVLSGRFVTLSRFWRLFLEGLLKLQFCPLLGGIFVALCPHAVARLVPGLLYIVFELMLIVMEIMMATAAAIPCRYW